MKRIVLSFILIISFVLMCMLPVSADSVNSYPLMSQSSDGTIVYVFGDGGKLIISPAVTDQVRGTYETYSTISSHRDITYEDSSGNLEWKYTLYGSFTYYSGVSATCTSSTYSQTIYKGNWTFSNGSATHSGNTARGQGNYVRKLLFITLNDIDIDTSLTCDIYGNVT